MNRTLVRPDRVRRIDGGFAFIPNCFLHEGFFVSLNHSECSLYLFLVLAGDRAGVCYYSYERICSALEVPLDEYMLARAGLIAKDLIAFDGTSFQVLSLPAVPGTRQPHPLVTKDDLEKHDPATVRQIVRASLDTDR